MPTIFRPKAKEVYFAHHSHVCSLANDHRRSNSLAFCQSPSKRICNVLAAKQHTMKDVQSGNLSPASGSSLLMPSTLYRYPDSSLHIVSLNDWLAGTYEKWDMKQQPCMAQFYLQLFCLNTVLKLLWKGSRTFGFWQIVILQGNRQRRSKVKRKTPQNWVDWVNLWELKDAKGKEEMECKNVTLRIIDIICLNSTMFCFIERGTLG